MRGIDNIVQVACIIPRANCRRRGQTLQKLGMDQISVSELTRYVSEGTSLSL